MTEFFVDTHVILAFLAGDDAAAKRMRSSPFRTGLLNLYAAEVAQLAADVAPDEARTNVAPFEPFALAPDAPIVHAAAVFLQTQRRAGRAFTLIDAVGYTHARRLGLPFLTGEPVFRGLVGAELLHEGRRSPS